MPLLAHEKDPSEPEWLHELASPPPPASRYYIARCYQLVTPALRRAHMTESTLLPFFGDILRRWLRESVSLLLFVVMTIVFFSIAVSCCTVGIFFLLFCSERIGQASTAVFYLDNNIVINSVFFDFLIGLCNTLITIEFLKEWNKYRSKMLVFCAWAQQCYHK